jgi:hypothetical protein
MRNLACVVLVALVASSGCFYPGRSGPAAHRAAYAIDAVLIVGGALASSVAIANRHDCCEDPGPLFEGLFGGAALAAGLVGGGVNLTMPAPDDPSTPVVEGVVSPRFAGTASAR